MSKGAKKLTQLSDLSPEQQKVVETWGKGMAVMAGAGAGKTTTLVVKCGELLKRKPDAKFAAVSFTEKSASDLRGKLSQRLTADASLYEGRSPASPELKDSKNKSDPLSSHWVMTIHGLCGAILREYPREAGFDGEETMLSEGEAQRLWERAIEQLWDDQVPEEIEAALEITLNRESRHTLQDLLKRARDLSPMGLLESLKKREDEDSQALAMVCEFVLDRYDRLKRRRGVLDFNDLERGADRALEHQAVREAFQKRFDLVLVDEFQDTNAVQARIILRFVKPDFSNLCVVGDPKQSIYRFRDADVSIFEDFCRQMAVNLSLTWNFRSRPGIIDFANDVCQRAFDAQEDPPMKYEALIPKRPSSEEFAPVTRLDVKAPGDLATWIVGEMKRGVPLEDMALLLRKIRGNERWLKALTSAGIPIAVGSGGLFWEDPRVRELVSFLKWWNDPDNTLSGAVFLRSPWVSVPDPLLDRWFEQDPTAVRFFFGEEHLQGSTTSSEIARALLPLRGKVVRPAELLMTLLVSESIEDEIGAPLLGLWHRVEDLSSTGLGFGEVVSEISEAMEEKRREREVSPPRNQGQIPVLTFHGAKGLEFKHVILVDLGAKNKNPSSPLLYWDRKDGAFLAAKDSMGDRVKKDPLEAPWKEREIRKELAENRRVFYVAITRAQERLILVCPELLDRKGEPVEFNAEEVYSQDFWRGWIECAGLRPVLLEPGRPGARLEHRAESTTRSKEPLNENLFPLKRPRHSVTEWNLLSRCPRAYEWTYIRPRLTTEAIALKGAQLNPLPSVVAIGDASEWNEEGDLSQRELGTRVHACLEVGNYEGLRDLEMEAGEDRFQADRVIEWAENSPYMNPTVGRFEKNWAELAFEIPIAGEILVGSMDRVVKHDQNSLSVVDFKVTRHDKSSEDLTEAYETQMRLYRWALTQVSGASKVDTVLVNFSGEGVREVRVAEKARSQETAFVEELAHHASSIIAGKEGKPEPGKLCGVCQFREICPEGRG